MDTNSIQEIINQKAEKRLDNELVAISKHMYSLSLFNPAPNDEAGQTKIPRLHFVIGKKADGTLDSESYTPYECFWNGRPFMAALKKYWLPIYIKRETEVFVKIVEQLQGQVSDLMNFQQQGDGY